MSWKFRMSLLRRIRKASFRKKTGCYTEVTASFRKKVAVPQRYLHFSPVGRFTQKIFAFFLKKRLFHKDIFIFSPVGRFTSMILPFFFQLDVSHKRYLHLLEGLDLLYTKNEAIECLMKLFDATTASFNDKTMMVSIIFYILATAIGSPRLRT